VKSQNIKTTLLFIHLLVFGFAWTQSEEEIYFTNINNSLNLPSQECYNILQDSKGYIWICTENGLLKYSKGHSKVFDKQNGLAENAVYYIGENKKGELELLTSANRILYIKNDIIREGKLTPKIQKQLSLKSQKGSFDIAYLLNRNNNGDLIINTQQRTFLNPHQTSDIIDLKAKDKELKDSYIIVDLNSEPNYFYKNNNKAYVYLKKKTINISFVKGAITKTVRIKLQKGILFDWRTRICNRNGITFLILHNNLIQIDEQLNVKCIPFSNVITSVYLDKNDGLWVGVTSNGVYHYADYRKMDSFTHGLSGLTVSSVLVDREGGTWCTTTEKGVYYSGNYQVKYYPKNKELNRKVTFLKTIGSQLFLSTEVDKLMYLENGTFRASKLLKTGNSEVTDICIFKGKKYVTTKGYLAILNSKNQIDRIVLGPHKSMMSFSSYQLDYSIKSLFALGIGQLYKMKEGRFEIASPTFGSKGRCFKVMNDSIMYVGCNDGLYKINTYAQKLKKIGPVTTAVSKIIKAQDGIIYFTTKGQGLFKLVNDTPTLIRTGSNNLILNDLIEDKNGVLWASSNEGLYSFIKKGNGYNVTLYNTANGLMSNSIGQLSICKDDVYVSSPDGICKFPVKTTLINKSPPLLYINQVKINDSVISHNDTHFQLDYHQNTIAITFDQINFRAGNKECLQYQLEGLQTNFKKSNLNTLYFENLPPDTYKLLVYTINNDGIRSLKPVVLQFIISPPFWKTMWFILSITFIILIIIFLIVKQIIKNIRKREEEKTRINKLISESQMSALQAQMNPHFIFNAINSIQNYILDKNEEDAYNYLTKFSKLVRLVLNYSKEKEITLQAELEMLGIYIELEQLRFDKKFEYTLFVSDEVNPFEVEIPVILIQPYVENAIWHGLMNLDEKTAGHLKIEITTGNNLLKIIIEDNGIGREKARQFKKGGIHSSVGMQLTEERLKMIKSIWNTDSIKVIVHDLYHENNQACGTRVELFLPLN